MDYVLGMAKSCLDTRARGFAEECRRQSRAAAKNKRTENDVLRWIATSHDHEGWK